MSGDIEGIAKQAEIEIEWAIRHPESLLHPGDVHTKVRSIIVRALTSLQDKGEKNANKKLDLSPDSTDRTVSSVKEKKKTNNMNTKWKQYKRKGLSEMRPYEAGEDVSHVSISEPDKQNGSPKEGDMIARNPVNHADQWLVAKKYFEENLEPA